VTLLAGPIVVPLLAAFARKISEIQTKSPFGIRSEVPGEGVSNPRAHFRKIQELFFSPGGGGTVQTVVAHIKGPPLLPPIDSELMRRRKRRDVPTQHDLDPSLA
jgi:hypothetical protein